MPDNKMEIIIEAVDNVSKKLDAIQQNIEKTGVKAKKSFIDVASAIFIAQQAYRVLSGTVKAMIDAASEQEEAVKRLNFALKNQGTFTEELSEKYVKLANSLQSATRFSDESIQQLMQQLVAVGNVGPAQMERVTRATLDFATATGTNLASAQDIMAKAAAGNTAMLGRYGIILDDNIPKSEKFAAALKFIEQRFGGSAQEDIKSYAGQMAQLKNIWNEFLEGLGGFLIKSPITKFLFDQLSTAANFYKDILGKINTEQEKYSTDATRSMAKDVNLLDAQIKAYQAQLSIQGLSLQQGNELNDMLINRQRLVDTIARLEGKSRADNDIKNAGIQAQQVTPEDTYLNGLKAQQAKELSDLKIQLGDAEFMDSQRRNQEQIGLLNEYKENFMIAHQGMAAAITTLSKTMRAGLSSTLSDVITGARSAKEAFSDLGRMLIKTIVDFMVQKVVAWALEKTLLAGTVAATTAASVAMAAAWYPAAFLATVATLGAAAAQAPASLGAAGALGLTVVKGLSLASKASSVSEGVAGADGGDEIVTRPTLFLAGEAGPERVNFRPMNNSGGTGGGGEITINLFDAHFKDESDARRFTEMIGFEIERKARNARTTI